MAKLLGQLSCTAWPGRMCKHKQRVFPSLLQSLRAVTGSLEENMLPLLQYCLTLRVKKKFMLCQYRAATSHFFHVK